MSRSAEGSGPERGAGRPRAYLAVNSLALPLIAAAVEYFWFIWMTPALLIGQFCFARRLRGNL